MDPAFYGLKRAYHSTLRLSRRDFKELGNTAARMDILHALYNRGRPWKRPLWQSTLRRIIGYTARSTMTEILQALEKLLWIRRKRSEDDRRQLEVELTAMGRNELQWAYARFDYGWPLVGPSWATDWGPTTDAEDEAWYAFVGKARRLDKILLDVRFALRDTGSVRYLWFGD